MLSSFALKPKVSEKSYELAESRNTYIFEVPREANKHSIAREIAKQFEVTVTRVRISSVPGKMTRSYRRQGRNIFRGKRSDIRKAYVTLAEGDKLPIFSAVEEQGEPDKDQKGKK